MDDEKKRKIWVRRRGGHEWGEKAWRYEYMVTISEIGLRRASIEIEMGLNKCIIT